LLGLTGIAWQKNMVEGDDIYLTGDDEIELD
jgi:hypothetical protein